MVNLTDTGLPSTQGERACFTRASGRTACATAWALKFTVEASFSREYSEMVSVLALGRSTMKMGRASKASGLAQGHRATVCR